MRLVRWLFALRRHGRVVAYADGCRCERCESAWVAYRRNRPDLPVWAGADW